MGPDCVEVGEQQDWFAGGAGRAEVQFEDVAVLFLAVVAGAAAETASVFFCDGHGGVDGGGIFTGRLLLDQLAETIDEGGEVGGDVGLQGLEVDDCHLGMVSHGVRVLVKFTKRRLDFEEWMR